MTRGPVNSNRPRVEGTTGHPRYSGGRTSASSGGDRLSGDATPHPPSTGPTTPHPSTVARSEKRARVAKRRALDALVAPANPVKPGAGGPPALHALERPIEAAPRGPGGRAPHSTRYPTRNAPQQAVNASFPGSPDPIEGPGCPPPTKRKPRKARHPLNRGAKRSWRAYRKGIAAELRALGRYEQARRVRECGETALVYDCASCGETAAAVTVLVHCDSRACPQCAARLARERVDRLSLALHRVADTFHARRAAIAAELGAELEGALALAAKWSASAAAARDRFEAGRGRVRPETIARASRLAAEHRERAKLLRWQLARLREDTWGWKLLTISPQWDPSDETAVTVSGLRARAAAVWERWARVWRKLAIGGAAAAVVSLEISSGGHVHIHALVWAPFVHARHIATLAGCFVDIREVRAKDARKAKLGPELAYVEALREACKYAVKAPRVSLEWVRGERATVTHPALAARWATAQHGRQCGRLLGLARDAMRAHEAEGIEGAEQAPPVPSCPCCMAPLGAAREARTSALVKRWHGEISGEWEWRHRVRFARAVPVDAR